MLREALSLLPQEIADRPPAALMTLAAAGVIAALAGARYSRSIVTLAAVGAGTWLGLRGPAWIGWTIDPIGAAFCGAIIFGVAGFALHRTWIGAMLAAVLAGYAGLLAWIIRGGNAKWVLPELDLSQGVPAALSAVWRSMPEGMNPSFPAAVFGASAAGLLCAAVWPRLARVLFYSLGGAAVAAVAGALAAKTLWPRGYEAITANTAYEVGAVSGFILLTSAIQWWLLPKAAGAPVPSSEKAADANADDPRERPAGPPGFATSAFPTGGQRPAAASRRPPVLPAKS